MIGANTGLDVLSGEFNRGYTKAILDIINIFKYIQPDMHSHGKRMTDKLAIELLDCIVEHRESLRESPRSFIRWNPKMNGFELYKPLTP